MFVSIAHQFVDFLKFNSVWIVYILHQTWKNP